MHRRAAGAPCGTNWGSNCDFEGPQRKRRCEERGNTERSTDTGRGSWKGLRTIEPHGINAVGDQECVEIDVAVASGAMQTVISEATRAGAIDIIDGPASKTGDRVWGSQWLRNPERRREEVLGIHGRMGDTEE